MNTRIAVLTIAAAALGAGGEPTVPFPKGYRQWTFLHGTMVGPKNNAFGKAGCEKPCTGGIFYFYANEKALDGFRTGKFQDGAVIADEFLELHGGDSGGAKEGPRRGVGVMVKDSRRYEATGGWGYAAYDGDSQDDKTPEATRKACFGCHVSRKDQDYVFSKYDDR
jgi:hypothetical protein